MSKPQVDFILVRPQFPGNTGAVARALKNCAFDKLTLVQPQFSIHDLEATKYAVGAKDLLENAIVSDNLLETLAPYQMVIATSRRRGNYRKNVLTLSELSQFIAEKNPLGQTALLFGTEAHGLSNDEFQHSQYLMEIPANPAFESFNLSQAVLLVAYELFRHTPQLPKNPESEEEQIPTVTELEGMYGHLTQMLTEINFVKPDSQDHIPRILRNILSRALLTKPEVRVIRGICRQILWYKEKILKGL